METAPQNPPPTPELTPQPTPSRVDALSAILLVPVVVLAQWVIPGMGYVILGQRARGITIGLTILILFTLGLLIGGIRVVEPATSFSMEGILARPWYVGQCFVGPIAILTGKFAAHGPYFLSHSKTNEIGLLYTAVAGMMNLFSLIDLIRLKRRENP